MTGKWLVALISVTLLAYGCQRKPLVEEGGKSSGERVTSSTQAEVSPSVEETTEPPVLHETFQPNELLASVKAGDLSKVEKILNDSSYQIDEIDEDGNTPLNVAVHQNQIDMAKGLIDHGADINRQNKLSDSPYLYAGAEGRTEILAYMLAHAEPDLTKVNRYGGNALIPAAEKGHLDTVQLLLADGRVEIDFQNNYGYTALIETVALNDGSLLYQTIAQALLEGGADQKLKDDSGRSAADYASYYQYRAIADLLTRY